ncbi:MAG: hypothetical protein HY814_13130 [Candidatus Riflebacteria bacterium]|nr:hypothetical protein [Candidatus Riflebacteria bacterium]
MERDLVRVMFEVLDGAARADSSRQDCPEDEQLLGLLEQRTLPVMTSAVRRHLATCGNCLARFSELQQEQAVPESPGYAQVLGEWLRRVDAVITELVASTTAQPVLQPAFQGRGVPTRDRQDQAGPGSPFRGTLELVPTPAVQVPQLTVKLTVGEQVALEVQSAVPDRYLEEWSYQLLGPGQTSGEGLALNVLSQDGRSGGLEIPREAAQCLASHWPRFVLCCELDSKLRVLFPLARPSGS